MHRRALLVVLLAVLGLTACSSAPPARPRAATPATTTSRPSDDRVSFVVVGDSITAGPIPIEATGAQEEAVQQFGSGSWLPKAQGRPLRFLGGWAVSGATTEEMRAGVVPAKADVVVVMAGTNDLLRGVPWEQTRANLLAIVDTVGVHDVLVSAVPPADELPAGRQDFDQRLRELADQQGWHLVDPWVSVEQQDGSWVPGASADGVHPTQATADAAGRVLRAAVLDAAGD
jgi:lysophospholipase L1-like esterase